jgi:integrase/recombinase XerD
MVPGAGHEAGHEAWEELFFRYLLTEKRVAHNTFDAYKRDIEQLVAYLTTQNLSLALASSDALRGYVYELREEKKLTPRSVTRKIASIKSLFGFLHSRYGFANASEGLLFPKLEKLLPDYLTEHEVGILLQAVDKAQAQNAARNRVMIYLLYASGMRVSELVSLELQSLHHDTGFIDIAGKGGKGRTIPLPPPIMKLIQTYCDTELAHFNARHPDLNNQYLFPVLYGHTLRAITRQALWGILKGVCRTAGIRSSLSPHKLRHSFATHMLKRGLDLRSLQILLGHEKVATVQIYTHVEKSYLRTLYDKKHPRS